MSLMLIVIVGSYGCGGDDDYDHDSGHRDVQEYVYYINVDNSDVVYGNDR